MAHLSGSSEAADNLREGLRVSAQAVSQNLNEQNRLLNALSSTCHDSSYEEMEYLVKLLAGKLQMFFPQMVEVVKRLQTYSNFIQSLESGLSTTAGASSGGTGSKKSSETWSLTSQGMVYDSPDKLAQKLDTQQGKAGPRGTCGLCSVENVAITAGKNTSEASVVALAQKNGLCSKSGGTSPENRQALLAQLGIQSHLEEPSIANIAGAVASGRGVILSVDANKLYGRPGLMPALHAVTVTSVTADGKGNIVGVTICDSNARVRGETGAKTYSVAELQKAMTKRKMNVTEIIR